MAEAFHVGSQPMRWRNRRAQRLSNGMVELIALHGGGHLASVRFLPGKGKPDANILWEVPWDSAEPGSHHAAKLARRYGPKGVGQFLASFTGHALCLDYFGMPSEEEVRAGLPLHGEASCLPWKVKQVVRRGSAVATEWDVRIPSSGLSFTRRITLPRNQSIAVFQETVRNERAADHYFHWVQHVTFGAPFLAKEESRVFVSGSRSVTWPLGYEGKSLLGLSEEFSWPHAPGHDGGICDLSVPFAECGKGFVASVLSDAGRPLQYVAALNWRLGLAAGYCFRVEDFPWVAVWEENCARTGAPWKGQTHARGMEFGTTPMPIGREATFLAGKLFDTPCWTKVSALSSRAISYFLFLAEVPKTWRGIQDVRLEKDTLFLFGSGQNELVKMPARGALN